MFGLAIRTKSGTVLYLERFYRGAAEFTTMNKSHARQFFSIDEAISEYKESQGGRGKAYSHDTGGSNAPFVVLL